MEHSFIAERSVSPATGTQWWVVADAATLELHHEATAFLISLRSKGRSPNTERVYAGRVALYLNYCTHRRIDWTAPGFLALAGFQQWLVSEPLPPRSHRHRLPPRFRSPGTANAVMTVVGELLRFGARHGWVNEETVALLAEPKHLRYLPPGYDPGEEGQFRRVEVATFRFKIVEPGYQDLSPGQIRRMITLAGNARDRFLIALLACTGLRIGEALGLRRTDLHFLAGSRVLGCGIAGPHLHVHRRTDNPNGALAKSPRSRHVPVTTDLVALYTGYRHERDRVREAGDSEMVFVNLFRPPLGRPSSYPTTKETFDRLARVAGHPARPHMLRHSAATRWLREGVGRDVVQDLLGHRSPASMERYRHVDAAEARAAVDRVHALMEQP